MRLHISLEDELVEQLDSQVGARRRSQFIASAVRCALDYERRWQALTAAVGALADSEHEWDDDPAAWVREQRGADATRVG